MAGSARQRSVAGEKLERKGLKCVAHEERGRLVVRLMARRSAAAQIVVIHRRQIIVHQRIDMDQFQGTGGRLHLFLLEPERASRGKEQDRTYALASTEHTVPHRGVQPLRRLIGARQPRGQRPFHPCAPSLELTGERIRHGLHAGFPPADSRA